MAQSVLLKQPNPMVMEGDLGVNWKKFKNSFKLYITATGYNEKDDAVQAAVLLHTIGEEAYEVFESLGISEEDKKKIRKNY